MAVGMLIAGEGVTADTYRQINEHMIGNSPMRDDQAPDGLIIHTAGQSDQGWYVYDIWESREHFDRFVEKQLGPAINAVMGEVENPPKPQFFPIEAMVRGKS